MTENVTYYDKHVSSRKCLFCSVGFERKFNANGVEWEEDQYPKTKFVPQQEKYDPTSFKHKLKMIFHHKTTSKKARISFKRRLMHLKKHLRPWSVGSQDYVKFYFIKYNYNSKDSHQDDVDPEEEELESS